MIPTVMRHLQYIALIPVAVLALAQPIAAHAQTEKPVFQDRVPAAIRRRAGRPLPDQRERGREHRRADHGDHELAP
jgi:hypothetical protein